MQQKDLGRLYSAPLSYWKGLPFSIEEVVEDLRMAGYDQVDFSKVKQKGDFGYSKSKGEIHIVTDENKNYALCRLRIHKIMTCHFKMLELLNYAYTTSRIQR